jgi:hypothetical protein
VRLIFNLIFVVILSLSASGFNVDSHAYYVSICTIDYNKSNQSLELTFKLTAHDLEKSFSTSQESELRLGSAKEHKEADKLLAAYINDHFTLNLVDVRMNLKYVGKEVELNESLYLYFEIENVGSLNGLKVKNNILVEQFEQQENILHLNAGSKHASVVFNRSITSKEITLQ